MKKALYYWVITSFLLVVVFGTGFICVQQALRQNANELLVIQAEDLSAKLEDGTKFSDLNLPVVNVAKSITPFVIIYDERGNELQSSARLNGKSPQLPTGVLGYAKPQNRITWEPKEGVRLAIVVQEFEDGFILAGRSLREVENITKNIFLIAISGGFIAEIILSTAISYKFLRIRKKK